MVCNEIIMSSIEPKICNCLISVHVFFFSFHCVDSLFYQYMLKNKIGVFQKFLFCFVFYEYFNSLNGTSLLWGAIYFFTSRSAISTPYVLVCEGSYWKLNIFAYLLKNFVISLACFAFGCVLFMEVMDWMADLESTRKTAFWKLIVWKAAVKVPWVWP